MSEIYKFPNSGYNVTICKKQDILDCIDKNITDPEIALAIIEQLEIDASNFLKSGRWTGIPFIGNIRVPKIKQLESTPEQQSLIQAAKENLDDEKYILFRTRLSEDNGRRVRQERYYRYIVSIAVNKNRKLYRKLCKEKGEYYARIYLYACNNIISTDNEYVIFGENE